ncbi:flavin-binding protein [Novosphingobium fuchskuhlense]|uniref:flavin-binding protein n=1 Tax=Novosphingobium fuchskuhlense TaxID=1117702 RepID=UPI000A499482|nr:flavin-binding protein [Novosphingobium fuchskuhlense]
MTLDGVLADAVRRLATAVRDRRNAMHTPVVGTADGDLRMMVLREATADLAVLRFHTDLRSPKATLIGGGGMVSVLAYDPDARVQLRMRGTGRIEHAGPVADAAWSKTAPSSRRCYLAETRPGGALEAAGSAIPDAFACRSPALDETLPGRGNFAVLLVEVRSLDWLRLDREGGIRARFARPDAGAPWRGEWIAP